MMDGELRSPAHVLAVRHKRKQKLKAAHISCPVRQVTRRRASGHRRNYTGMFEVTCLDRNSPLDYCSPRASTIVASGENQRAFP